MCDIGEGAGDLIEEPIVEELVVEETVPDVPGAGEPIAR